MAEMPAEYGDIDWVGLVRARRALLHNPFNESTVPAEELRHGDEWFEANKVFIARAARGLCVTGKAIDARKLLLSALQAYARQETLEERMGELRSAADLSTARGLTFAPNELTVVGGALARFYRAIKRVVGVSRAVQDIRRELWTLCFGEHLFDTFETRAALRKVNVLILGETGTGKELVAEVLQAGAVADGPNDDPPPAITISCPALPRELAESELFGFEKGAFTGASERRKGKLVEADGGSLFLDEVADLPADVQVKLLSVMQNGKVTPLGSNTVTVVDVRYIAATSRPLREYVAADKFRADLYHRLGHVIEVPPLRDRPEDIYAIGASLLTELRRNHAGRESEKPMITSPLDFLREDAGRGLDEHEVWLKTHAPKYSWPGNVRELQGVLRQRVFGLESKAALHVRLKGATGEVIDVPPAILDCTATQEDVVGWYLARVFQKTGNNIQRTAKIVDQHRNTVSGKLAALGLLPERKGE